MKIINDVCGCPEAHSASRNVTKYSIWRGYNILVQCVWLKCTVCVTEIYSVWLKCTVFVTEIYSVCVTKMFSACDWNIQCVWLKYTVCVWLKYTVCVTKM